MMTEPTPPTTPRQQRLQTARLAQELDGTDPPNEQYLAKLGRLRMSELLAQEIVAETPTARQTSPTGEPAEPAEWPSDPEHPLNDPELVESLSSEQIDQLLRRWHQSPQYQSALEAARHWRARSSDES